MNYEGISKMVILCPFWDLSNFDRYVPQMKAVSDRIRDFKLIYMYGSPREDWNLEFNRINPPFNVDGKTVRWFLSIRRIAKQLRKLNPDLIYSLSGFMWVGRIAKSTSLNVPYVIRLRGDSQKEISLKYSWLKGKIFRWIHQTNLRGARQVIPISSKLRQVALKAGVKEERITPPVPIGVDAIVFRSMRVERDERFTVAYAGRISPEKRVSHFLKIAENLKDFHFIVAGRLQMDVSFPNNVKYFGKLPFSEMPNFYNKADLVVVPSVIEGFGNIVLEAYACEKPVLVARGALTEELRVYGSVVDISEFETEIRRLRSLDLKTVGQKARKYVEKHYTWEKFGRSIVNYLKGVFC